MLKMQVRGFVLRAEGFVLRAEGFVLRVRPCTTLHGPCSQSSVLRAVCVGLCGAVSAGGVVQALCRASPAKGAL